MISVYGETWKWIGLALWSITATISLIRLVINTNRKRPLDRVNPPNNTH